MKQSAWRTFVETRNPPKQKRPRHNQGAELLTDSELEHLHLTALKSARVAGEWPSASDADWALIRDASPRRLLALLDELRTLRAKHGVGPLVDALVRIRDMAARSDAHPDLQFEAIAQEALSTVNEGHAE